jgi:hypothetical protein
VSEWQPIETAPRDGTLILGAEKNWRGELLVAEMAWEDGEWQLTLQWGDETNEAAPTHWMPRPAPPNAGNDRHEP